MLNDLYKWPACLIKINSSIGTRWWKSSLRMFVPLHVFFNRVCVFWLFYFFIFLYCNAMHVFLDLFDLLAYLPCFVHDSCGVWTTKKKHTVFITWIIKDIEWITAHGSMINNVGNALNNSHLGMIWTPWSVLSSDRFDSKPWKKWGVINGCYPGITSKFSQNWDN